MLFDLLQDQSLPPQQRGWIRKVRVFGPVIIGQVGILRFFVLSVASGVIKEHRVKEAFINVHPVLSLGVDHDQVRLVTKSLVEISNELSVIALGCIL